jgi:hypothetical protein
MSVGGKRRMAGAGVVVCKVLNIVSSSPAEGGIEIRGAYG